MLHVLAVTLSFVVSPYEADSLNCELEASTLENVASVRLYGAPRYHPTGMPWLIRQKPASAGPDTMVVEDGPDGWTYWLAVVDAAGNESCRGPGITVGIPSVGVEQTSDSVDPEGERYYDLRGARLPKPPTAPGIYWVKKKGSNTRALKVVVF